MTDHEMYGTVSWNGEIGGQAAVIVSYKKGTSLWIFKRRWWGRGKWVRLQFQTREEALNAAGVEE